MEFAGMNYWAVVIAAAASFIFGGIYYGFFGTQWLSALGKTEEEHKASNMTVPTILTFVAQLVMAYVLAGLVGHLGTNEVTLSNGIISGFFVWLGFVITTMSVNYAYQDRKFSLMLIDGVHWLGVLLIQGAVIGFFGI